MIKLLTLALLFTSFTSNACKCTGNIGYLFTKSNKVYLGTVIHSNSLGDGYRKTAILTVNESFKGDTSKVKKVTTDTSSCGVSFSINEEYLVFEAEDEFVHQCSMTRTKFYGRQGNLEKDLEYLRSLRK